jgi:hypothetical protein
MDTQIHRGRAVVIPIWDGFCTRAASQEYQARPPVPSFIPVLQNPDLTGPVFCLTVSNPGYQHSPGPVQE